MTGDPRIVRAGRWRWVDGRRDPVAPGDGRTKPTSLSRALAIALTELTTDVNTVGDPATTGTTEEIDLFLDAGNCNAEALLRFAEVVDSGRRIRPSFATALEPSQIVAEATSGLGWTGQVITVVSDGRSAPFLPIALAAPGDRSSPLRVLAELWLAEGATQKEFTGLITAVLLRPDPFGAGSADLTRYRSVSDVLATRSVAADQVGVW